MRPLIIAHRGASNLAPENTLASFRLAKELGADGFECDVQLTKDHKLVILPWSMCAMMQKFRMLSLAM